MNRKQISITKVLRFSWLKAEGFESLFQQLKHQKMKSFLELLGKIYSDLVKVFFTNLEFKNDVLLSNIKGVQVEINKRAWKDLVGLKSRGVQVRKGETGLFQNSKRCNTMANAWGILLLKSNTSMLVVSRWIKGYLVWLSQKSLFHVVATIQHWMREIWYSCTAFNTTFKWIGSMFFLITCSRPRGSRIFGKWMDNYWSCCWWCTWPWSRSKWCKPRGRTNCWTYGLNYLQPFKG